MVSPATCFLITGDLGLTLLNYSEKDNTNNNNGVLLEW